MVPEILEILHVYQQMEDQVNANRLYNCWDYTRLHVEQHESADYILYSLKYSLHEGS